ncbi:cyclosome subunit-like protein [Trypanosoma conorhini]|uniref:Cyclosome subunit-like protein n=1 Tax=Trypanosoma conorhini TaxID=83891 RepID=A0A3R7P3Q2_9TRYP|nr:cyclosome subunit-like protein [Trypanosoma conorhini]RNF16766.1 cyclosome subunit-like protein [Trypanosoma conorhini]
MQSAFTIRVGEKQADGVREVSVLHNGEVHFSTSHRNVKWAFLTRFPAPSNEKRSLPPVGCLPVSPFANSGLDLNAGFAGGEHTEAASYDGNETMQEFLCVLHRDEPKDRHSHYTAHQASTICSAYNTVHPAAITHFVLKNIAPTTVVPGLRGVFVHGSQQSSRGSSSMVLQVEGFMFHQAADLWWMASQLTIRPVYVNSGDFELIKRLGPNPTVTKISPSPQLDTNSVTPRYALVDAIILAQFQTDKGRLMTVAVRGDEICLATTVVVEHLDALLWIWWPQRLQVSRLRAKGADISVTISESLDASVQVLFLFDSPHTVLHVLRTPNLLTGMGELEMLFSVETNCPPVVLPCLRSSMMQPVMVCHYPAVNDVTLYHVPTLLEQPSPSTSIATMSLAPTLPTKAIVNGVLYQMGPTVAFQATSLASKKETGKGENITHDAERKSYVVRFPSILEEQHPLVHFILESLELVLETSCVASLQCDLLRRAWESKHVGDVWDFGTGCIELIIEVVRTSITGRGGRSNINEDGRNNNAVEGGGSGGGYQGKEARYSRKNAPGDEEETTLCDILLDPIGLTADVLQHRTLCSPCIPKEKAREALFSSASVSQLWTQHQCGLSVFVLHLLCESFKLQEQLWVLLEPLAKMNLQLSQLMRWTQYVWYYSTSLCVPATTELAPQGPVVSQSSPSHEFQRALPEHILLERFVFHAGSSMEAVLGGAPPMLCTILQRVLVGKARVSGGWPAIKGALPGSPLSLANRLFCMFVDCFDSPDGQHNRACCWWFVLCRGLLKYDINPNFVASELCVGAAQPILRALAIAKDKGGDVWDNDFNAIIGRLDRLQQAPARACHANSSGDVVRAAQERAVGRQYCATLNDDDGVIMRPDFPQHWGDSRLDIVQTMLNTAAPIVLPSQVDGADVIYNTLKMLSRRATALPVGRGMFTLCTQNFRVRDSVPIPRLNLEGRTSDGITIANNSEEIAADNLIWPLFHNGCAAALRFLPLPQSHGCAKEEQSITQHWVLYQTRNITCLASRSGLILAAGLLGHLKVLQRTDIYSLLVSPQSAFSGREAVTIAVMLGLSCSLRGTCNSIVFNCLSMHVQSLTPATEDIEVSLDVQTAALVSIGILYQQSPDAFLAEMLLVQMSRLPSDEHFRDREGYALGAGFGLGLMFLGIGSAHGLPNVENRLLQFMNGARREAVPSACEGLEVFNEHNPDSGHFLTRGLLMRNAKESFRTHCTRVFEGDRFNTAVSSPAAVMALGFMYMQADDASMAGKVSPPNRLVGLQGVCPEMCLVRSMMSSLILWSSIEPTLEWIRQRVPSCLLRLAKHPQQSGLAPAQIYYLMMNLGHCLAGVVLALGMRYAGSMDADAKAVVLHELKGFMRGNIGTTGVAISVLQRSTGAFQPCISSCTVALALIMAGTGDARCLEVMQKLYTRTNVKYGDHLALSMAIGLLFLGGGQLTLSHSLSSVAALVMSFYPLWPDTTSDNKLHLQALRQLYCLAVVPRVIETIDVLTNQSVSVPIRVIVHRGRLGQTEPSSVVKELWTPLPKGKENQAVRMVTPCLLPDPSTITQIEIRSAQHHSLTIHNTGLNVIGDAGLVVRILEKNVVPTDSEAPLRSPAEEIVVRWIKRLFHAELQQRPRPIEAIVILDNFNLLFAAKKSFLTEFGPCENVFSPDFVMSVRRTLVKRYGGLLQHCGVMSACHPLVQVIMMKKSLYSTAVSLVQTLKDGAERSCDLAPVLESLQAYVTGSGAAAEEGEARGGLLVSAVMKWLSQALHFYGLVGSMELLPQVLEEHTPFLQRRERRLLALYVMNQRLLLEPQLLEDLVECFVEYVD